MSYTMSKIHIWAAPLENRPGVLHKKLETLRKAGANLEFVIARPDVRLPRSAAADGRSRDAELILVRRGKLASAVAFVAPIVGAKQEKAAAKAGFAKAGMCVLRVEASNRAGLAAEITGAVAAAGINLCGYSAAALGETSVSYLRFSTEAEAAAAAKALKKALRT